MKEFELEVIETVIPVYQRFIEEGLTTEVKRLADGTYGNLVQTVNILMSEKLSSLIDPLEKIGTPNIPNENPPTKKEAIEIVERLKALKKEILDEMKEDET
ncbi:MAG: hypothetical protein ACLFNK_00915 [Candidatus Woesearchaeota archaeon]